MYDNDDDILSRMAPPKDGIFAIHGDLDGHNEDEFQERDQFIGIKIGSEEFLLPISNVREIIMVAPITFVPFAPANIDGVFNLRGSIVPIINTQKLMGLNRSELSAASRIIVTRYEHVTFGLIVDGITYVRNLLPTEVEQRTLPGKGLGAEFITSICKQDNYICGILDIPRIISVASDGVDLFDENPAESEHAA